MVDVVSPDKNMMGEAQVVRQGAYMRNKVPFILCMAGGLLLISADWEGSIGYFSLLENIASYPELEAIAWILQLVITVLTYLAGLGGITVIAGGCLLTTNRFGTGKLLIGLGAGMGVIGFIVALVTMIVTNVPELLNFLAVVARGGEVTGAVLSVIARMIAKEPESK